MSDKNQANLQPSDLKVSLSFQQPVWRGWTKTPSRYLGQPIWWHSKDGLAYEDVQLGVLIDLPAEVVAEAMATLNSDPQP